MTKWQTESHWICLLTRTQAERNYRLHSGKLEFLALKWAVTERFRDGLFYGPSVTVYRDNNPLTYVLTTARLNATGHRWVAELSDSNLTLKYRPGKVNTDADFLSRSPLHAEHYMEEYNEKHSPETVKATLNNVQTQQNDCVTWISAVTLRPSVQDELSWWGGTVTDRLSPHGHRQAELKDAAVSRILELKSQKD